MIILLIDHIGWVHYFGILNNTQKSILEQK